MGWFINICNPEFSLIDGLVTMFIDKVDQPLLCTKILKILRKLNEHLPDLVCDQFFNNRKFPETIVKYLSVTKLEDLAGDAFLLLINIFDDN